MYNQTNMDLEELEVKMCILQNLIIEHTIRMDELWQYHPINPDFVNPIKAYRQEEEIIKSLEEEISSLKSLIETFNSTN